MRAAEKTTEVRAPAPAGTRTPSADDQAEAAARRWLEALMSEKAEVATGEAPARK